jgi:hypothetical protein
LLWNRTYPGHINSIIACPDGVYVTAGVIETSYTFYGWALKIDGNGDVLWEHQTDYPGGYGAAAACPDGGYVLVGNAGYSGLVVKLDEDGGRLWNLNISLAAGKDHFNSVSVCPGNGFLLCGESNTLEANGPVTYTLLLKLEYPPAPTPVKTTSTITSMTTATTTTTTSATIPTVAAMCVMAAALICGRRARN